MKFFFQSHISNATFHFCLSQTDVVGTFTSDTEWTLAVEPLYQKTTIHSENPENKIVVTTFCL